MKPYKICGNLKKNQLRNKISHISRTSVKILVLVLCQQIISVLTNSNEPVTTSMLTPSPENSSQPNSTASQTWTDTQILIKKGVNLSDPTDPAVRISSPLDGDFHSLIRNSAFWVDKSLLVRKIWKDLGYSRVIFTAPPKWGKSINLSMLKFYCQLPVDEDGFETPRVRSQNYRYFKEGIVVSENGTIEQLDGIPLISGFEEDFYLASYPVIYVSGANLGVPNGVESFRIMLHETYNRHEYLLRRLVLKAEQNDTLVEKTYAAHDISKFRKFYDLDKVRNLSRVEILNGLRDLVQILYNTYNRNIIILFDDYDQYIRNTFFDRDQTNSSFDTLVLSQLLEEFMSNAFKYTEHVEKVIITGVLWAKDEYDKCFTPFNNYYRAYVFDYEDLSPFYGIFENEFYNMAHARGISQRLIDDATNWYGGYRTLSRVRDEHTHMYSPHSVSGFLSSLQVQVYWPNSSLAGFMRRLLRKSAYYEETCKFCNRSEDSKMFNHVQYDKFRGLHIMDYLTIQRLQLDDIELTSENLYDYDDLISSLLVSFGYATIRKYNLNFLLNIPMFDIYIEMANQEIYNHLCV